MSGMATERTAKVARRAAATGGVVASGVGGGVEVVVAGRGAVAVHVEIDSGVGVLVGFDFDFLWGARCLRALLLLCLWLDLDVGCG